MFKLMDASLDFRCGSPTPWCYCCEDVDKVKAGSLPVEVRMANGDPAPAESDDFGFRLMDLVAVHGTLEKTEAGNMLLVVKNGWFQRDRPEFDYEIHWPKE